MKPDLFFVYFRSFHNAKTNIAQCEYVTINDNSEVLCLGLEPGAAAWKAQTNPQEGLRRF